MAERTVKVNLVADVSEYTASLARAAAQTRGLSDSVQAELKRTESNARSSGERAGGTLARGINLGLVRNSPLIVAGLSGALAAGAPAVTAGAVTLFAGIGAAAVSQTAQVRRAWTGLGSFIRDSAAEDAASLVPVFTRMASQLASTFDSLRPQLRAAFEAAAPQIDGLTDSFARAAQVAVPALVRAVQAGAPVMAGLADLVESIGEGIAGFMDAISEHTGAAGTALSAIGDVVGALLPVLGELLGQGAELASEILPPLASALQTVADVLDKIAPVLPAVAAGFLAFKGVGAVTGLVNGLSGSLAKLAEKDLPGISAAAGNASGAMSKLGSALPVIGIATAGLTVALQDSAEQQNKVTAGFEQLYRTVQSGGPGAVHAQELLNAAAENGSSSFLGLGADVHDAMIDAKASTDAWWASLSPLQQANEILAQRQTELNIAIEKYGVSSPQAIAAANAYRTAQADVAYQEGLTELAIDGVTQAMIDQYNQAIAATNSAYAYRDSQNAVEDAQAHLLDVQSHLNDSNAATRTSTEDVSRAGLQLEEALMREAGAAGQLAADALPATASELDRNTASAQGTLAELYRMRDEMGGAFPASLQTTIANLENTGVHVDTTSGQFDHLRDTVNNVPVFHNIHVAADLGPAEASLNNFINKHWSAIISTNVQGSGGTGGSSSGGGRRVLAAGGRVSGPGGPTSDSIPAMLSDGEFVVNAASTTRHLGLLQVLNARRGFADGGLASKDWTKIVYNADLTGAEAGMLSAQKSAGQAVMAVPVGAAGAGVARWSGLVLQALSMMGQPASLLGTVLRRMNQESGGNPNAINLWDVNAKRGTPSIGLMQTIGPTFRAYHDPRSSSNIYDPLANVLASMRYALSRYGSLSAAYNRRGGYETGTDFVPETGPAVLHKGEAVLTREQGEAYRAGLRSREVAGVGSNGGGAVTVNIGGARIAGTLDLGGGLEARIDGHIIDALTTQTTWGAYQR